MVCYWDWYGNSIVDFFLVVVYEVNNEKLCGVNSKFLIVFRIGVDILFLVVLVFK